MDKDEQAPTTPPETPEVEKPAEPAEAPKVEETPKAEEAPKAEAPVAEVAADETEPAKSDVAAEMDRLLNEEAASSKPEQEVKPMVGKSHNHVGIIIVLSFLVLISVGFAIYMYLTSNKKVPCDCPKCETTECDCDKDDDETSSSEYIYIGEWGVKIKIGSDLAQFDMHYISDDNVAIAVVKASDKDTIISNQAEKPIIVSLARSTEETYTTMAGTTLDPVYSNDKYHFFVVESTGYYLDLGDETLTNSYLEANESLVEILKNADSYSEI